MIMNKDDILGRLLQEIDETDLLRTEQLMRLATRIADAARYKGYYKNKDLAKALQVSPSLVSKWLSGDHNFTAMTLFHIADKLRVELINIDDFEDSLVKQLEKTSETFRLSIECSSELRKTKKHEQRTRKIGDYSILNRY